MISPQPGGSLYRQLAARIRADIMGERLRPGQKLPSERTLMQEYGFSRETIRSAYALLRAEGQIVIRRGQGAYVREQPDRQQLTPPDGAVVTARMPTDDERAELGIAEGVPLFWVVTADGTASAFPADRWELRWPAPHPGD